MATIKLMSDAETEPVREVARSVAERHGYLWERESASTATVSEGGKPIKNKVVAVRLRPRLRIEGDVLTLTQDTNGVVYTGRANAPGIQVRIAMQARKLRKATSQALAESGLAA